MMFEGANHYDDLKSHYGEDHVVPVAVGMESELNDLEEEDRQLFIEELGDLAGGVNRVVRADINYSTSLLFTP